MSALQRDQHLIYESLKHIIPPPKTTSESQKWLPESCRWPQWKQTCTYNSTQLLQQLEATTASKAKGEAQSRGNSFFIMALILKVQRCILQSQVSRKLFWLSTSYIYLWEEEIFASKQKFLSHVTLKMVVILGCFTDVRINYHIISFH